MGKLIQAIFGILLIQIVLESSASPIDYVAGELHAEPGEDLNYDSDSSYEENNESSPDYSDHSNEAPIESSASPIDYVAGELHAEPGEDLEYDSDSSYEENRESTPDYSDSNKVRPKKSSIGKIDSCLKSAAEIRKIILILAVILGVLFLLILLFCVIACYFTCPCCLPKKMKDSAVLMEEGLQPDVME